MKNISYGRIIREIREGKKITLDMLADEVVSKSMLSKFERDQADISLSRFIHIIGKLHITFAEFFLLVNSFEKDDFELFNSIVREAYENESMIILDRIISEQEVKWKEKQIIYYKLNAIMVKALKNNIKAEKNLILNEDINILSNYLFDCENWGNYELNLYGNSMSILPYEFIVTLSKELISKVSVFQNSQGNLEKILNLIINTILICLKERDLKSALFLISYLKNSNIPEAFFLERLMFTFTQGMYTYLKGEESGKDEVLKALEYMKFIGSNKMYWKFKNYFDCF